MSRWWRWLAVAVLLLAVGAGSWLGWRWWRTPVAQPIAAVQELPEDGGGAETVETVQSASAPVIVPGATPMRERVAVLGLLNKRNGRTQEVTLKPGQGVEIGDVRLHLRACDRTAPWEDEPLTGAFVQVDIRGADRVWRRPFSGWLFKERPNLNVVQHPVYDVWTKSCAMSFPATGPDTERLSPPAAARSRAPQSPGTTSAAAADGPTAPANATDSAAR